MEKTRVNKGEKYWYIHYVMDNVFSIEESIDDYEIFDNYKYKYGNYFHTKEEAKSVALKFLAVLAGADVIEMPSEEEIEAMAEMVYPNGTNVKPLYSCEEFAQTSFKYGVYWLKSKIIK